MSTSMSGQLKQATDNIVAGKITCALSTSQVPFAEKYQKNPITMADLQKLADVINENELCHSLSLVSGNCGVMAITLRYMLGGQGQLWRFGECDDESDCSHIVLYLGRGRYIDGKKLWKSKADLVDYWDREFTKAYDEQLIVNHTTRSFTVEQMEKILSGLLSGHIPDSEEIDRLEQESGFKW